MAILDTLLIFSPFIVVMSLIFGTMIFGGKKSKKHIELVTITLQEYMKSYVSKIEGPYKLKPDVYEYRCIPRNSKIGVLTLNYTTLPYGAFPNNLLAKALKDKEKFFIGLKFRKGGRDINPVYKFHLVPYRNKGHIRRRFDEYVKLEDIQTKLKQIDRKFMVKSGSAVEAAHFVQNDALLGLLVKIEQNIEALNLDSAKEDYDPHLQATFKLPPDQLHKLGQFLELFFLIAKLHIENQPQVKKLLESRKSKTVVKKTRSAKKRRK